MYWNLKICKSCGEIMGCFPKKKCQFCDSKDIDVITAFAKFFEAGTLLEIGVFAIEFTYLGVSHVVCRVSADYPGAIVTDNNGGYYHVIDASFESLL